MMEGFNAEEVKKQIEDMKNSVMPKIEQMTAQANRFLKPKKSKTVLLNNKIRTAVLMEGMVCLEFDNDNEANKYYNSLENGG